MNSCFFSRNLTSGFLALTILHSVVIAEPLKVFSCPPSFGFAEINACPAKCTEELSSYAEFEVDIKTRSVLKALKISSPLEIDGKKLPRGHVISSEIFENCKIFDKKNWDCSTKDKPMDEPDMRLFLATGLHDRMVSGVYKSYLWTESSQGQYTKRKKSAHAVTCMVPFNY